MTAQDYQITFPYGAISAPYSPAQPHRGDDRKMPVGVPVVVGGVTIGLSGRSGSFNGIPNEPHLHTQAGTDFACQQTIDPKPYEFKVGTVVAIRTVDEKQWGKYVTIQTESGMYITYAHLSEVKVKVGQIIKEVNMIERGRAIRLLRLARRDTSEPKIQALMQKDEDMWLDEVYRAPWFKEQTDKINAPTVPPAPLKPGVYEVKG